jgi:hypothetical protein
MEEYPGRLQNYRYIEQEFVTVGKKLLRNWGEVQKSGMNG